MNEPTGAEGLVEQVLTAMSDALRTDCTDFSGECFAHGFTGFCAHEGGWSGEVDGEIDLEPLARAAIEIVAAQSSATIAALTEEVGRLREALEPFASWQDDDMEDELYGAPDDMPIGTALYEGSQPTVGDLRRARAALTQPAAEGGK